MDLNKLKISDLVAEQLPDFVADQFPTFVKFFEEYYRSLEIAGGIGDITENFLDYRNLDNLRKFDLVKTYDLQQDISSTDTSIVLDKLDGLPSENGIVKIDDEIIFYRSVNLTSRTLLECERGFSGVLEYSDNATKPSSTVAATHLADAKVTNLSNLIKFLIVRNYEIEYLDGFPFENISDEISRDTLVRNIKDFYSYKGTDLSIEFLFRSLFDEEVTVRYPKDYVIKSSYSDWTVDDIIKVEEIDGNPYDLVGNELRQSDASGAVTSVAVVDQILVNNIQNYASGTKNVYEIRLNVTDDQYFTIPNSSIVRGVVDSTSSVITVDSTIGFPELNGIIQIDDEVITYRYKTFNQFIDCGRGSFGTVAVSHADLQPVVTTEFLFGYKDGAEVESNKIKLRLLGSLASTTIIDGSNYYNENEVITLSQDGTVDDRKQFTEWRKNESGVTASSSDVQINNAVSKITSDVTSVYKDENFAYVASTGLPSHPIGAFRGVGFDVKNQNILKAIPLKPEKNTQEQLTGSTPVGLFVNGVEAFSAQDYEDVAFGDITQVFVNSKGFGFENDIQPVFRVVDGTGSNATFKANINDGKVISVDVVNGGSGYTSDRVLEVSYGFDATASVQNDGDLVNGQIRNITVTNPGTNYVVAPKVEITDITGKGNGAFATAQITNNQVTGITVLNGGVDYTDKSNIRVRIISKASGVEAVAIVRKWSFDRVFKTQNEEDANGNWGPAQTIKSDSGNGYLYPSRNVAYNLQYGYPSNPKILRHTLVDNVQGVNANYDEKTTGNTHSPILGWAYDGNPIYGPYGYSQPLNENSGISRQTSSYSLKSTPLSTRPSTTKYPLGTFVQDYEFNQGNGSLDKNNGRFCKTPEYPDGRYCYFLSVDALGAGVYPYIIGTTYYSVPSQYNFNIEFNQSNQLNLPPKARRIRSANTPSRGFDASLLVGEVQRGEINSFTVKSSGDTFKNLDYIYIDNTDTEGSRSFGRVERIKGKSVPRVSYGVQAGFSAPGFTTTNNLPDLPWPVDISGPQYVMQGLMYDINVQTSEPHLLSNGDQVRLELDRQSLVSTKTFKVRVSNYQTVHYTPPVANSVLVADVSFNQTTVNVDVSTDYRENDYIMINDEILKITSINYSTHQLTVERSQFGTPIRLHAATNAVSLHIPDDDPHYRIAVGSAISTPGVSGVIYSVDKANTSFEVRVSSGSLTNASAILDASTPTGRQVTIDSVGGITTYYEIDPTNTGNYYRRDLQFRVVRGTEYTFDLSDGSNFGYNISFSEDSTNINPISNVEYLGTPGQAGARVIIKKDALLNNDVTRIYYYEQNYNVVYNEKFFSVLSLPDGVQTITVVDDTNYKFTLPLQPEQLEYVNVISYNTTSKSATGEIQEITVIDGGEGYKKLPKILGVVHGALDNAKFTQSITGGSFESVSVINQGSRYSNDIELVVNTNTGTGAVLTPTIVGGRITSVAIDNIGSNYDSDDTITVVDKNAEIFAESDNIGKVKSARFNNYGSQFTADYTLAKSLVFDKKVIVVNVSTNGYKLSETVTAPGGLNAVINRLQEIGKNTFLLDLHVKSGEVKVDDVLTGAIQQTTSTVYSVDEPDIFANVDGFIKKVGFFDSDLGKLNASSQKITDSYYYQDFSYVIRSTKGLSDYKKYVDETTHPLGFKLFGEVSVENDVDFEDTVTGAPFSIGLANDPHANEVLIQLPTINVESEIVFKKYEVSTVKAANLKSYLGTGAAQLNFLDNQIEAVQIADLTSSLNASTNTYDVITNDGTFPTATRNSSVVLALNEIFQEPFNTGSITGVSYDGGLATFTTSTDHNLAITVTGQTYPKNKYIHTTGITNSVQNINFNDQFAIYDVPSSTSFRVTIDNPNGTLTNNDPAICADVKSTIDNLTTIVTYYLSNPTQTLPVRNNGIWTDPTQGPVSANRHRDGANLIYANKQEIIDRANAQISIDYPDFYYPNDPQTTSRSRYKDAYRLIQLNRQEIIDDSFAEIAIQHPTFVNPNSDKCKRDIGYFIDAVSLDVHTGGNVYARKFLKKYFNSNGNTLIVNGLSGEIPESVTAFNKARDLMKLAITNQLTVTDLTITPGNSNYWGTPVGTPTAATYDPATGISVITIPNHGLANGDSVLFKENSFTFTCTMDGEASIYREIGLENYTSVHNAPILFTQATDDPTGGSNQTTWLQDYVTDIQADSANAAATLTTVASGGHNAFSLQTTDGATLQSAIRTAVGSSNPSGLIANQQFPIVPTDNQTFSIDGTSYPIMGKLYVPTGLAASSLDVVVVFHGTLDQNNPNETIGSAAVNMLNQFLNTNTLNIRDKIIFSVAYPQDHIPQDRQFNLPGVGREQADFLMGDNLPYARAAVAWVQNSLNGYISAQGGSKTINDVYLFGHSQGGKLVSKINTLDTGIAGVIANSPGPIQFDQTCSTTSSYSCSKVEALYGAPVVGGVSEKTYPRVTDGNFNTAMTVTNVTADTFQVNVGASPLVNFDVTAADYDPESGDVELTIGAHTLSKYESIKLRTESLVFTCDLDNNATEHAYPKRTLLTETIDYADYDPVSGVLTVTVNNHGWEDGDFIKFDDNSVTFTCALDNNQTEHSYPRAGIDPYAGKWLPIFEAEEDTFKVQVGVSSDTSAHTFVRASQNGLKKKKDKVYDTAVPITATTATTITINVGSSTDTSTHTFVSALSGAVISGGNYTHTFVSAAEDAVVTPVTANVIANNDPLACADVRSNIDNLAEIVTFYLNQGSLLFPVAIPNESVGVPSSGEAVCKRDLEYFIDALIGDMRTGGNSNVREIVEFYLEGNSLLPDGLAGELNESITAFNKARDMAKLAIANQLYEKDFTILPDFLTTSGTLNSADVTGATFTKGQFSYVNSRLTLFEAPKEGTTFHSIFFKFINSGDDSRYSYRLRDILFDGTSKRFNLKKENGSNVTTEADENLLVFIDGVLQIYGESYTIDRSVNPNQIVFTEVHSAERHFFAYTFSKYKVLNNFSHEFNSSKKSFEFKFGDDIILPPDDHQILVLLDGVPQVEGTAYTIVDNVLTFTEAPTVDKNCHCLYFYGKTFDKTISIWNGNVFEKLEYLGDTNPEGCRYFNKVSNTGDIIFPGDLIKIDGETTKEIIKIDQRALENTDNLLYTAFVYTDNSYVRGKNAVANAVVSGVPISGGNTVGIQNTVGVQGTQGVPPVFDYQVTGVNITNPGLEYDVAPIVLFKTECNNPGTGAEAYAEITNGRVTNVVVTNPGSGYTEAPELIFAKKYEIIRPKTPLFAKQEVIVDSSSFSAISGFGVVSDRDEEFLLPIVVSQLTSSNTTVLEVENKMIRNTSDAGLAYNLQTFDNNKFQYEPLNLNDPLASYLGTGVTIEHMNRYAPALTVGDFTTHRGVSQGASEPSVINIGPEAYVSYGLTLNGAINDAVTTVTVTGNLTNFPPAGYLEFGDEIMEYTSISGQDFTVVRGSKSTTATAHADGDYLRLAWRG